MTRRQSRRLLLAHFGGEAVSGNPGRTTWAALGLGLVTGLALHWVMLAAFAGKKWQSDPLIGEIGVVGMALAFLFVAVFLARNPAPDGAHDPK